MKKPLLMLQEEFFSVIDKYTNQPAAQQLWSEIQSAYTADDRHFHTLAHLEQMLEAVKPLKAQIEDWDTLMLAIFFHDFVYDVVRYVDENDNEEKSADEAEKALQQLGLPQLKIDRCKALILATKDHKFSSDRDTNYLTDADLLILGQSWGVYKAYMDNIRKEYAVYPDKIYYAGRSNFLKNFLRTNRLFKTDHFYNLYEAQAKENLERELEIVSFH